MLVVKFLIAELHRICCDQFFVIRCLLSCSALSCTWTWKFLMSFNALHFTEKNFSDIDDQLHSLPPKFSFKEIERLLILRIRSD